MSLNGNITGGYAHGGMVAGGTTGQVITKKSNEDYDIEWATLATVTSSNDGMMPSTDKTKLDAYTPTGIIISTSTTNLPSVVDGALLVAYDA